MLEQHLAFSGYSSLVSLLGCHLTPLDINYLPSLPLPRIAEDFPSGSKTTPLPKICRLCPTMMNLGTLIPYLKRIQEIYQ